MVNLRTAVPRCRARETQPEHINLAATDHSSGTLHVVCPCKRDSRLVPYGILLALVILTLFCLAFCIIDYQAHAVSARCVPT